MAVMKRGRKGVFYMHFMLNGIRVSRSTGKYNKREATQVEAAERQKILLAANQTPQERAAQTLLQDAVDHVYETSWRHNKDSERSYARAAGLVKMIGNVPVREVDDEAIRRLLKRLDRRHAAPGTINRYLAALKMVLKSKKQDTNHIKLRKERKGRLRVISREEEQQIVGLLRDTKHSKRRCYYPEVADLVEVLVDTGMRLGELLALKYEDVDFSSNLITIWINKGDRPRSIPMTKRVNAILLARQARNRVKPFPLKQHQAQNAWRWVRKEMKLLKDKEFVLHALRHSCASRLVNQGIDLYVVKEWLGHSTIQVTEKYAHLAPEKLAAAVKALERN